MKQVINLSSSEVIVKLTDGPIPRPAAHQVLIKVVVSGCNPKDWKRPIWAYEASGPENIGMGSSKEGINQGDDIAGVVESVGEAVLEFKVSWN